MQKHSKIASFYKIGDIKYYWKVHCKKMEEKNLTSVTYPRFWDRLERWWCLEKAIKTPSCKTKIQTDKSLDELLEMNRIQMPKPKQTLWRKLVKWLSKKRA